MVNSIKKSLKKLNIKFVPIFQNSTKCTFFAIHESYYWKIRKEFSSIITEIRRRKLVLNYNVVIYFVKYKHRKTFFYEYAKHILSKNYTVEQEYYIPANIFYGQETAVSQLFESKRNLKLNKSYKQTAVIVPTLHREDKIIDLVRSLHTYEDDRTYKIMVGDQSGIENKFLKSFLESMGHEYYLVPKNAGLSATRNILIEKSQTPYIFICDDDTVFTNENPFFKAESVLLEKPSIGLCAGQFDNRFSYFDLYKFNNLYFYVTWKKEVSTSFERINYITAEVTTNFFLAKREFVKQIKWQDELKFGEHIPYFLDVKKTHWKVCYTPEITCVHNSKEDTTAYKEQYIINREEGYRTFYKKENIMTTCTKKFEDKMILEINLLG